MTNKSILRKSGHSRNIFQTGEYIRHFRPEDKRNPFSKIYKQKKQDTIKLINGSGGPRTVLDIGGGMGRLSLELALSGQNRVVLVDISTDMLKLAIERAGNVNKIRPVNSDAHYLPFRDRTFDFVVGLDLLCHMKRPETVLSEFHRVLKDEGTLIIDSTNSNPLWTIFYPRYMGKNPLNWLKTMKFQGVLPGWEKIVRHYSKDEFFALLTKAGFEITKNLNYGPGICPKWHLAVSAKRI